MEFIKIESREDFRADEIYSAYCKAFPEDERRSQTQFADIFKNQNAGVYAVLQELDFVGYLVLWELSSFVFLEHFEVFPNFRGMNLGSEVLTELNKQHSHIILEAEPENLSENAKKRIEFYQKNSFTILDENYTQPSYSSGKQPVEMFLMGNFLPENKAQIVAEIYDVVYGG